MNAQELKAQITDKIRRSELKPGNSIGFARELAEQFEIPLISVNRALHSLAAEGLIVRIKRKGSFVSPKALQQPLRIGTAFQRYLESTPENEAAIGVFWRSAQELLARRSFHNIPFSYEDLQKDTFDDFLHLDGLIVTAGFLDSGTIPILLKRKYPIVIVQHTIPKRLPLLQVTPDTIHGFAEASKAFRAADIRKIIILSDLLSAHLERCAEFRSTAQLYGYSDQDLPLETIKISDLPSQTAGYKLGEEMLRKGWEHDSAFFMPSDILAFGFLSCFLMEKLIPGVDFRLISFDNLEADICPLGKPYLTSIDYPKSKVISEALELLYEHIANPESPRMASSLAPKLIFRETFRAPFQDDSDRNNDGKILKTTKNEHRKGNCK